MKTLVGENIGELGKSLANQQNFSLEYLTSVFYLETIWHNFLSQNNLNS